ncbi:hypothetical protein [Fusobacterium ulcerans]|uniref:hypothetical protein n=1 Tax=Fusobacterium ulcerans TaxID=861 RepID=UPI003FEEE8FD
MLKNSPLVDISKTITDTYPDFAKTLEIANEKLQGVDLNMLKYPSVTKEMIDSMV